MKYNLMDSVKGLVSEKTLNTFKKESIIPPTEPYYRDLNITNEIKQKIKLKQNFQNYLINHQKNA